MKPGATTRPRASSVVLPARGSRLIRVTVSPSIPRWPTASKPDSGSMIRPPDTTTSWTWSAVVGGASSRDGGISGVVVVGTVVDRGTAGTVAAVPALVEGWPGRRRRKANVAAPKPRPITKRRRDTASGRRSSSGPVGTVTSSSGGASSSPPVPVGEGAPVGSSESPVGSSIAADASGGTGSGGADPTRTPDEGWLPWNGDHGPAQTSRGPGRIRRAAGCRSCPGHFGDRRTHYVG